MTRLTVLTACLNNASTIGRCFASRRKFLPDARHLIQDGGSTDGSLETIRAAVDDQTTLLSVEDSGLYDALNKLVESAESDWLLFLHADDELVYSNVLTDIERADEAGADAVAYGVAYSDVDGRVYRSWRLNGYRRSSFRRGYMLPHTGLVMRRELFERFGMFRKDLGSAADYEWILRVFYKGEIQPLVMPGKVLTHMRSGGLSNVSLSARLAANRFDSLAWRVNELTPPPLLRVVKPLRKLGQFFG